MAQSTVWYAAVSWVVSHLASVSRASGRVSPCSFARICWQEPRLFSSQLISSSFGIDRR